MSDSEEEWITVRRRRGGRNAVSRQLKKLAIPVVPLAFDALAEPEESPAQDVANTKKKKKGKRSKAVDAGDEEGNNTVSVSAAATGSGPSKLVSKPAGSVSGANKNSHLSFFAWLWSRLVTVLVLLGLMKAVGSGKKKRKSKAQATPKVPEEPARVAAGGSAVAKLPATVQATAEASAKEKEKPQAAAAPAKSPQANQQQQQQQRQQKQPAGVKPTSAAANGAVTPATSVKKQPEVQQAAKVSSVIYTSPATHAAAATPLTPPDDEGAPATPPPPSPAKAHPNANAAQGPKAVATKPQPPPPQPAPATPAVVAAPPPPSIKFDADWSRGKFVMQSLPTGHADVVSAVALAGDIAVSAGYDGAVKLWSWPSREAPGGGVAPRLVVSRALVGHSGRVEALSAHAESRRLATSGRDSTLKVWDLGSEPGGSGARELASTYVYESIRSLAVDWVGEGAASAGRVLLGARSGTVLLYSLGTGGVGRKVAAMRGHQDEATALKFLYSSNGGGGQLAVSGSRDGTVRLWDLRTAGINATAVLNGLSGRVCSLAAVGDHHLVAGDCSSSVKLWDLRQIPPSSASRSAVAAPPPRRLPNAPGFAGDICPTAGLWHGTRSGVLLSSCIAWWTSNKEALEEAPSSAKLPMACLNVSAVGVPSGTALTSKGGADEPSLQCQYQYTLRLGPGVVTCLAGGADEGAVLAGGASGALWALRLVRGSSVAAAAAERAAAAAATEAAAAGSSNSGSSSCEVVDALVVGAEEFSDDEYDDGEEEEDE